MSNQYKNNMNNEQKEIQSKINWAVNQKKQMAFENFLKSFSATIQGCNGNEEFLKMILQEEDYKLLITAGLWDFCNLKTTAFFELYPLKAEISRPQNNCPKCGTELKFITAGISKNGKPYDEFYSCKGCGYTKNLGADKSEAMQRAAEQQGEYEEQIIEE